MCTSVSEFLLNCFCFKQKTAYEMRISDWSSDVCSSDLQSRNRSARPDRERNPERRHVERLPGEGSGTRRRPATYIMHNRLIQKLASDIASSASEDQLYGALSSTASRLGFDHFALAYDRRGASGPASLLIHDYPDPWARLYVKLDLGGIDPVRRAAERSMTGFGWHELDQYIPLTKGDRRMLEVGRDHGVGNGFTVPRHLPGEASGDCRSEEHTSELQSLMRNSYAVCCLKKKKKIQHIMLNTKKMTSITRTIYST